MWLISQKDSKMYIYIYRPAYLERSQIGICKVKNRDLL